MGLVNEEAGRDLTWMFDAYLREADLPSLETVRTDDALELAWQVPGDRDFPMPVPVRVEQTLHRVSMEGGRGSLAVDRDAHVIVDPQMEVL